MAAAASVGADLSAGGMALNIAQRLAVTNALTKLKVNEKLPNITFWGKIFGVVRRAHCARLTCFDLGSYRACVCIWVQSNDYYLGLSVINGANGALEKRFYFSADSGVTFARLPPADQWVRDKMRLVFSKLGGLLFTGQPGFEYKDPTAPGTIELARFHPSIPSAHVFVCVWWSVCGAAEDADAKDDAGSPPASPKAGAAVDPNKRCVHTHTSLPCLLPLLSSHSRLLACLLACFHHSKMTELERLAYTVESIERWAAPLSSSSSSHFVLC
jgi:hypothetical protein